ncbi:MAG TPA: cytochrome P460 family protein [Fimbriimonadaceae bacterium]|nr:cytochrome P460 family protein [Fimbriimonadaceae bacterium]
MKSFPVLVVCAGTFAYGCYAHHVGAAAERQQREISPPVEIAGYKLWRKANAERVKMEELVALMCALPPRAMTSPDNPHKSKFVWVYGNTLAAPSLKLTGERDFPVGSVIVKEKYDSRTAGNLELLTVMIKGVPGSNPACGDWEFAVVSSEGDRALKRGPLPECMSCHSDASKSGFVFTIAQSE